MILITGGSGSGKSAFAEQLLESLPEISCRYYLATMKVRDPEAEKKVERHRRIRRGKGFLTIEQPENAGQAARRLEPGSAVLLECMSNLAANEMFGERMRSAREVEKKVLSDMDRLRAAAKELIVVTNNVFEDGIAYGEGTAEYQTALARINRALAKEADRVVEVVAGIPVDIKGGKGGI